MGTGAAAVGEKLTSPGTAATDRLTACRSLAGPVPQHRADVEAAPRLQEATVDLHLGTIDGQGRVRLAQAAGPQGWQAGSALVLLVHDGVLRLVDPTRLRGGQHVGIAISLDARLRLQLPFGVRTALGLRPGTRLVLLGVPSSGTVVGFPVSHLVERLASGL